MSFIQIIYLIFKFNLIFHLNASNLIGECSFDNKKIKRQLLRDKSMQ